jgi:hypothetical protein
MGVVIQRHVLAALTAGTSPGTYRTGGCVVLSPGLYGYEQFNIPHPHRDSNSQSSSLQRVAIPITPSRLPNLKSRDYTFR